MHPSYPLIDTASQLSNIPPEQYPGGQNYSGSGYNINTPGDFNNSAMGYSYDRTGIHDRSGAISPIIQNEISNQINQGLKNFFINLDQKLEKQRQTGINKKQSWSMQQLFNSGR